MLCISMKPIHSNAKKICINLLSASNRIFVRDETIAKYIEPIAEDEKEVLFWVFRCIDWAFIRAELKEQAEGESIEDCIDVGEYYHQAMRKELLGLYLFCKETPVRPKMTNEITLTINKGVKNFHRKITIPNYSNWMLRSALLHYCEEHLGDTIPSKKPEQH